MANERGIGKCENNHTGSFGYPTRPPEAYPFCSTCGRPMVWACVNCEAPMPEDATELTDARFCRECGTAYFENAPET